MKTTFQDQDFRFEPVEFHGPNTLVADKRACTMYRITRLANGHAECRMVPNSQARTRQQLSARFDAYRYPRTIKSCVYEGEPETELRWTCDDMGTPLRLESSAGVKIWTYDEHARRFAAPEPEKEAFIREVQERVIAATGIEACDWWYSRIFDTPARVYREQLSK